MEMNKLPPGVREALRKRGCSEAEVAIMSPREVFEHFCNWNGIINWSDTLWDTMQALVQAQPVRFPGTHSLEKLAEIQGLPARSSEVNLQLESPPCMGVTKPLEGDAGAAMPKTDGELQKIVVMLTGGIVDEVLVGDESVPVSVAVIDIDKNADLDDLVVIPEPDGTKTYALAAIHVATANPARVDELYAAVEEAKPAAEDEDLLCARP